MDSDYTIRAAREADIDTLVAFTLSEAREAEGIELDVDGARRGVSGAFGDPPHATYWVAETTAGRIVAGISVVKEWSNFRGGWYWWVQSLFIEPEHRGQGLAEALLDHLSALAGAEGGLELRLYAHRTNERALRTYRRLGFGESHYVILSRRPESNDVGET